MAKKYGLGGMLAFGAVTAALGGIAAYKHRKEIEKAVQDIADQLDAAEEDGFFSVDLDDEPIVHTVPSQEEGEPDSDFADLDDAPVSEEVPEEPEV